MASFSYSRTFTHLPWRNHEDVVDAEGENGFNRRFQDLEAEFDTLGGTILQIGQEVDRIEGGLSIPGRQLPLITVTRNIGGDDVSEPELIDTYDNSDFPNNEPKLYSVRLVPLITAPHGQVSHHFIYRPDGAQTQVQVWFKNERSEPTGIVAHIFTLS